MWSDAQCSLFPSLSLSLSFSTNPPPSTLLLFHPLAPIFAARVYPAPISRSRRYSTVLAAARGVGSHPLFRKIFNPPPPPDSSRLRLRRSSRPTTTARVLRTSLEYYLIGINLLRSRRSSLPIAIQKSVKINTEFNLINKQISNDWNYLISAFLIR